MDNELLQRTILVLECLKKDAEMALSGEWDTTTQEGIDTGFEAQVSLITPLLDRLTREITS